MIVWCMHCRFVKALCTMAALFLGTRPSVSQTRAKQAQPNSPQTAVKEVLSWLPQDTETIIGANGPLPLPDFDQLNGNNSRQPQLPSAELELRMRILPLGLF